MPYQETRIAKDIVSSPNTPMNINTQTMIAQPMKTNLLSAATTILLVLLSDDALAASCPFDTPGTALTREGLVLSRYANGFTGNALVANSGFAATDAPAIQSNIVALTDQLDLNRNGSFDTTDATIISRKIAGFSNAAATAGIPAANLGPGGASAVNSFLLSSCVSNGYRIYPGTTSPIIIGGHAANEFGPQADGAIVAGGGSGETNCFEPSTGTLSRPCRNYVNDMFSTVSGGGANIATERLSTVSGGSSNTANAIAATVSGGAANTASGVAAAVNGGESNSASGNYAVVSGGKSNRARHEATVVGGGKGNVANGSFAVVSGGNANFAGGEGAVVIGGYLNQATGNYSFASGITAQATHDNAFVWGGSDASVTGSSGVGTFTAYAPGGFYFFRGAPGAGGCTLPAGTVSWSCTSDRNTKTNITSLSARDILKRVTNIPITRWSYKGTESIANIGPMAQDFWREFKLGDSDKSIASMNMSGVALAAIQGLNQKLTEQVKAKDREIAALKARLDAIEKKLLSTR